MKKLLTLAAGILTGVTVAVLSILNIGAWDNGLAKTPPMGWNSWNIFHGDINETKIKQIADAMVSSGMKDAGYVYLNLDDNWMANPARDANGNLKADPTRFPSGIKALSDYVHAKGLKLGIYGDRGTMTCMNVPQSGSKGYEDKDAKTFASWGIDYLKYDNCNIPNGSDMKTDYQKMQTALANCGRPIVFSICAWEYQSWMPTTGNLWRTTRDITDKWDTGTSFFRGIINLIDENAKYTSSAKPGAWNDPDMLEVGNGGCTTDEYRTQMSMWSMMASPLIAGNDIRTMSQTTKDLLMNKEVIAVDQDPAGIQGSRVKSSNGLEIWVKPLGTDGTTKAVALLNRNSATSSITVNWSDIGLSGSISVRDLWAKADKGSFTGAYTVSVPSHGTVMLKVTSAPQTPIDAFKKIEAENYSNQSGIQNVTCDEGTEAIGYIENGDYAVYRNVDFGSVAASFKARTSSATNGGKIEIRLDSITGPLAGTCTVAGTSDWQTFIDASCDVSGVNGKHDLYLKFTGESGYLFNLNWFQFAIEATATTIVGDLNGDKNIDATDYALLKMYLLGSIEKFPAEDGIKAADLNADGTIDALDFAVFKKYLLGDISKLPTN